MEYRFNNTFFTKSFDYSWFYVATKFDDKFAFSWIKWSKF